MPQWQATENIKDTCTGLYFPNQEFLHLYCSYHSKIKHCPPIRNILTMFWLVCGSSEAIHLATVCLHSMCPSDCPLQQRRQWTALPHCEFSCPSFPHFSVLPEMMPSQSTFSRDSFLDKHYNIFLPSLLAELVLNILKIYLFICFNQYKVKPVNIRFCVFFYFLYHYCQSLAQQGAWWTWQMNRSRVYFDIATRKADKNRKYHTRSCQLTVNILAWSGKGIMRPPPLGSYWQLMAFLNGVAPGRASHTRVGGPIPRNIQAAEIGVHG